MLDNILHKSLVQISNHLMLKHQELIIINLAYISTYTRALTLLGANNINHRGMSHPFNDQMECILLCVPRDQSHIS
jgi:hypothetical protein